MTVRVLRPVITFTTVTAVLMAALAVYAFLTAGTTSASTYDPITTAKYCNALFPFSDATLQGSSSCTENLATSAAADYFTQLDMTDPSNLNFANVVTFAPNSSAITDGNDLREGAKVGGLRSLTNLGFANQACNSPLTIDFIFYNVDLPDNMADPRASSNIAFPRPQGSTNRFGGWNVGSEPTPTGGTSPGAVDADGTSIAIVNYPSYLLDLFDADFVAGVDGGNVIKPIVPLAVYGGLHSVSGTMVPLYFAQFDDTGSRSLAGLPQPFTLMDPDMGQPSVSVLNDPTAVQASPSSITDFCTPLDVRTMLLGTTLGGTGGTTNTRALNPSTAGTHFVAQYNASLRDTDQDGFENALDACPFNVDAGNPRTPASGDNDSDGLPDSCDPDDNTSVIDPNYNDADADAFQNRQDNCPQTANTGQEEDELGTASPDGGVRTDGIGNACDSEHAPITVVQNRSGGTWTITVDFSDSIGDGRYQEKTNLVAKCFGVGGPGVDADGDGYCAAQDSGGESGACAATTPPSCTVRHGAWAGAHPGLQTDTDGDSFSDAMETYMGTDPVQPCAATPVPPTTSGSVNDETLDNYPMDFNDDRLVSILDVGSYSSRFGKAVNAVGVSTRYDLNSDGLVSILDVGKFSGPFGKRCGAGTAGMPGPFGQQ